MTKQDADALRNAASELDHPQAIVSHVEVLDCHLSHPGITPRECANALGISPGTARRLYRNLVNAGIL